MDKKPRFEQEYNILAWLSLQWGCLSFLPTLHFHLKVSTWVLALITQLHVPLILWGIWLSTKDRCQVIIFFFRSFCSCDIICWLKDKNYTNVALESIGRLLCHCLGDKSWSSKRDIRNTVIGTCVSRVTHCAFSQ